MFSPITQPIIVVTFSLGVLTIGASHIACAASDSPVSAGDEAASAQAGDAKMQLRFAATETPPEAAQGFFPSLYQVRVGDLFFSADGETVYVQQVAPSSDGLAGGKGANRKPIDSLSLWSVPNKKKVKEIVGSQTAALSRSGETLGLAGMFKNKNGAYLRFARLVDATSGEVKQEVEVKQLPVPPGRGFADLTMLIGPVVFDIDGKRLLIRDSMGVRTLIWDFNANKLTPVPALARVQLRGMLPDGKSVLGVDPFSRITGAKGTGKVEIGPAIAVHNLATGKLVRAFGRPAIEKFSVECVLAADGKAVATIDKRVPKEAGLELWDVSTGERTAVCKTKIAVEDVKYKEGNNGFGQPGGIRDAAFSADGRFVASCLGTGQSGYVHLFDAPTGRIIASEKLAYCPQAIAFSRDGNNLAVAGGIGPFNLNVWNISDLTSPGAKQGK